MPQQTMADKLKNTDKEVAVLQVQYVNLAEKIDDVRNDIRDARTHFDQSMGELKTVIKEQQADNKAHHDKQNERIGTLEKWKWMIMGGAIISASLITILLDRFLTVIGLG